MSNQTMLFIAGLTAMVILVAAFKAWVGVNRKLRLAKIRSKAGVKSPR